MRLLSRIESSRFSRVNGIWSGATVVVVGCGPSITSSDLDAVHDKCSNGRARCIAVNDAYLVAPFADVVYFADSQWFNWHVNGIAKPYLNLNAHEVADRFSRFRGQRCSNESSMKFVNDETVHFLRILGYPHHGYTLSTNPEKIGSGRNSGFQAWNIALLSGASNIILVGFDGGPSPSGQTHFHGGHPKIISAAAWSVIRGSFAAADRQLVNFNARVFNCSSPSKKAINVSVDEALSICIR